MKRGLLIAFEGIDGSGKSTQLRLLAIYLRKKGFPVLETREPTDGPYGRKIRQLYNDRHGCTPEEELELFLNDRRQHVREVVRPALERGDIVLTDRYYYSTAAYQGAAGLDPEAILKRNSFAPQPDLVLLLTLPPERGLARIRSGRGERPNAFEQLEQLHKVDHIFSQMQGDNIVRINADTTMPVVQEAVRQAVARLLEDQLPAVC